MPPKIDVTRHRRNGPALDVAICGARGVAFGVSTAWVTCPACIAKHADPVYQATRRRRMKEQSAGRRKAALRPLFFMPSSC